MLGYFCSEKWWQFCAGNCGESEELTQHSLHRAAQTGSNQSRRSSWKPWGTTEQEDRYIRIEKRPESASHKHSSLWPGPFRPRLASQSFSSLHLFAPLSLFIGQSEIWFVICSSAETAGISESPLGRLVFFRHYFMSCQLRTCEEPPLNWLLQYTGGLY